MYKKTITINITHTEASGVIFHGRIFELTDIVYEEMLEETNMSFSKVLEEDKILLPVVNCNADFYKPVSVGDKLKVEIAVEKMGKSSFVLWYQFRNARGELTMEARVTIVSMDKRTRKAISIPDNVMDVLEVIQQE